MTPRVFRSPGFQTVLLLFAGMLVAQPIPNQGDTRLLIVFVRFRDDTSGFEGGTPSRVEWESPDELPKIASSIVSPDPLSPFPANSLTDYFYQQSNGRLTLWGTVYPRVFVTKDDEARYVRSDSTLGTYRLTTEILRRLQDDPAIELADFDANGDGELDPVVVILRRLNISRLASEASGIAIRNNLSEKTRQALSRDHFGVYVRYDAAGNIFPEVDLVRLIAHELGHGLGIIAEGRHLASMAGTRGTPSNDSTLAGYALMLGSGGAGDGGGHPILSAFERDVVHNGWISCPVLTSSRRVRITELYSSHSENCFRLGIPLIPAHWEAAVDETGERRAFLYLSNHQRNDAFDRLRTDNSVGRLNEHGLMTTGLLATMGIPDSRVPLYSVIPADNTLRLSDTCAVYDGDMFGPDSRVQLTPWTRPNINGYSAYPEDTRLTDDHFQAIDNIHYTGEPGREMGFDYVRDFRVAPVIREESWIGHESGALSFERDFVVTENAELTISTLLTFSGTWRLEKGARVVVEVGGGINLMPSSVLEMEEGSQMIVRGTCTMDGTIQRVHNAELVIEPEVGRPLVAEEPQPLDVFGLVSYPNPSRGRTTIQVVIPEQQHIRVDVVDAAGRLVVALFDGDRRSGELNLTWNAGASLAGGMYLIRLKARDATRVQPLVHAR